MAEKTTKESAKGQAYGIWRLTDLQGTNISFFLFKNAQGGLWKESEGTVVAVFKPQVWLLVHIMFFCSCNYIS